MKIKSVFIVLPIVAMLLLHGVAAASSDQELIDKVTSFAKWTGRWSIVSASGELEISFYKEGGKLQGEITRSIGGSALSHLAVGPLKWVEVKKGVITFTSQSGTDYYLRLETVEEGTVLKGKAIPPRGYGSRDAEVILRPAQ